MQRVVVMEKTNARFLESLPEPVSYHHHGCILYFHQGLVASGYAVVVSRV